MKTRNSLLISLTALLCANNALAQIYNSGLIHVPLGDVTDVTPLDERRVRYCCLGSSGEDGVDILLNSYSGGGAGVDVSGLAVAGGGEIKIKIRGWDGTIKGRVVMTGVPGGLVSTSVDYTDIGATAVRAIEYASDGTVVSDTIHPGPLFNWIPPENCPPPLQPTRWVTSGGWVVWGCGYGRNLRGDPYPYARVVSPIPPYAPGDLGGIEALEITGSNLPELITLDASLGTFGLDCWGNGQAQLSEQCNSPIGCTPETAALHVANIGSSGQDGVTIDLGPTAGGADMEVHRAACCRGHVTVLKAYDDGGTSVQMSREILDELTDECALDADFSEIGAFSYRITLYGPGGVVVGPPGGTEIINGGPRPIFTGRCPNGREKWINVGTSSNPVWQFDGCEEYMDFVLPGGVAVPGVAYARLEPINPTSSFGRLRQMEVATIGATQELINAVQVSQLLRGDLNCDGVVDFFDIDGFLLALFDPSGYAHQNPSCPRSNADCNNDGVVDFFDIDAFLACLFSVCP